MRHNGGPRTPTSPWLNSPWLNSTVYPNVVTHVAPTDKLLIYVLAVVCFVAQLRMRHIGFTAAIGRTLPTCRMHRAGRWRVGRCARQAGGGRPAAVGKCMC